jgi:hypothetical protein
MDFNDKIEKLASLARMEPSPRVDVAQNVMAALASRVGERIRASERQMMWFALCSSALAAMIAVAAVAVYYSSVDPVTEVSQAIFWVVQ